MQVASSQIIKVSNFIDNAMNDAHNIHTLFLVCKPDNLPPVVITPRLSLPWYIAHRELTRIDQKGFRGKSIS